MTIGILREQKQDWPSYSRQRFKSQIMPLHSLYPMIPSKSAVSIHYKSDMLRYRALTQCPDEQLAEL